MASAAGGTDETAAIASVAACIWGWFRRPIAIRLLASNCRFRKRNRHSQYRRFANNRKEDPKNVNKCKGPGDLPGPLGKTSAERRKVAPKATTLLVFLGLLLGRSKAFQALQKLFFRHALNGDLGVIRIDRGPGGADQRHRIGFRFVHFDEFLQ